MHNRYQDWQLELINTDWCRWVHSGSIDNGHVMMATGTPESGWLIMAGNAKTTASHLLVDVKRGEGKEALLIIVMWQKQGKVGTVVLLLEMVA